MSNTDKSQQNGIVKCFMMTLREEYVDYTEYTTSMMLVSNLHAGSKSSTTPTAFIQL